MLTSDTLHRVRHGIAILVFGIVMPVFAFFLAYPGGVSDMVNRLKYSYFLSTLSPTQTVVLKDGFDYSDFAYFNVVTTLQNAPKGSRVNILVKNNMGGAADLLIKINEAIRTSKAYVTVSVEHFGFSCGTYILNQGDLLVLPNDAQLLFHTGSHSGGIVTTRRGNTPFDPWNEQAYTEIMKIMKPYRSWVTPAEYEQYKDGTNIWVSGSEICNGTDGRKVPVLFYYRGGCVIKGFKGNG